MSTDHIIHSTKKGFAEYELYAHEQSNLFSLGVTCGYDPAHMEGLTTQELGKIAFRLLEVVSYYDPSFAETLPEASDWVKGELRSALGAKGQE